MGIGSKDEAEEVAEVEEVALEEEEGEGTPEPEEEVMVEEEIKIGEEIEERVVGGMILGEEMGEGYREEVS
jgi:hypothetical protein